MVVEKTKVVEKKDEITLFGWIFRIFLLIVIAKFIMDAVMPHHAFIFVS
jgi:hypothetical protein